MSFFVVKYWDDLVNRKPTFFDVNMDRYISLYRTGVGSGTVNISDIEIRKLNLMRSLMIAVVADDRNAINGINLCIKSRFPDIKESYPVGFKILERYGYSI